MLPRRSNSSGNSHRRSSILKPPKSRQPFQDLDFNASSTENSPETTKKRRVSFAEKKHVKEFCDHKEQGTIWDSTYEEPDNTNSKSSEHTNENDEVFDTQPDYAENLDIMMKQAGYEVLDENQDPRRSETFLTMHQNRADNSATKIFFNTSTEIEMTNVIGSIRGIANDVASKTIHGDDVDLDTTETIGGIEPTVSIDRIRATRSFVQNDLRGMEKTMMFDNSDGDMKFTEVINSKKISQNEDFDNIEDHTIIFDDFVMDLTPIKYQPESVLSRARNLALGSPRDKENAGVCNKYGNKTVFFNDSSCDITEAVNTVMKQIPEIQLLKQNINQNNEERLTPISGTSQSGNRTICFNDVDCEMTEAISTLKTRDKSNTERIIPPLSTEMEIVEPIESLSNSSSCKPSIESCRTNLLNESGMELTTAITRLRTVEDESEENLTMRQEETEILDGCDVDVTSVVGEAPRSQSPEVDSRERTASLSCGLSSAEFEDKKSQSEQEMRTCENTFMIDSTNLSVEENPGSKSDLFAENETQNSKKRKSLEITDVDNLETCNSSISINSEHHTAHDESCLAINDGSPSTFAPNSKRIKVTDSSSEEEESSFVAPPLEVNIASKTIDISLPDAEDPSENPSREFENLKTADTCVRRKEEPESREKVAEILSSSCSPNNWENLPIEVAEAEVEELFQRIEEEKCSILEDGSILHLHSDSETESIERTSVSEKRQLPTVENSDVVSPSKPSKFLDHNDDCCFIMFCEELEKRSKSDNCIWEIRFIDTKKLIIDFISKSLVVVIHLEAAEELTTPRMINDIRIISLLGDSANEDLIMIHNILLTKLEQDNLTRHHRTTQDVLPLLELISQRIKLLIDFMVEFDKLQDLHLINRTGNRISFRLHSYKVQLVIKITINLEPFEEISPNDVTVECVLGTIREKDIKQLISSVKKDHKFLTNYIKDVKEYFAVVVEK